MEFHSIISLSFFASAYGIVYAYRLSGIYDIFNGSHPESITDWDDVNNVIKEAGFEKVIDRQRSNCQRSI